MALNMSNCIRHCQGFTLVELVVALILIAILAVAVFPRAPSGESLTIRGRAEQLASDIRYVQTLSMTRGSRFCVVVAGSAYELQTTDAANNCTGTREPNPAGLGSAAAISLCSNCTVTTTFGGTLQFNGKGKPYTAAATPLASDGDITISDSGGSETVRVSPETGRAIVQ